MKSSRRSFTACQKLVEALGIVNRQTPETRDGIGFCEFCSAQNVVPDRIIQKGIPSASAGAPSSSSFDGRYRKML
jgi:hypothetical protein